MNLMNEITKRVFFGALAISFSVSIAGSAQAQSVRDICSEAQSVYGELSKQLPMRMDAASEFISASAWYLDGECYVRFGHLIDLPEAHKTIASEAGGSLDTSLSEFIDRYRMEEHRKALADRYRGLMPPQLIQMADFPGFRISLWIRFQPEDVPPIEVKIE